MTFRFFVSFCLLSSSERELQLTINKMSKWETENGLMAWREKRPPFYFLSDGGLPSIRHSNFMVILSLSRKSINSWASHLTKSSPLHAIIKFLKQNASELPTLSNFYPTSHKTLLGSASCGFITPWSTENMIMVRYSMFLQFHLPLEC